MTPGLAKLVDEIGAEGPQRELSDALWRLAYTRGYVDVDCARPYFDRDHAGILVFVRPLSHERALLVLDDGRHLAGAVGSFGPLPRAGSAVRLAARRGNDMLAWRLIVDEALPLPLTVCFDRVPSAARDRLWIGVLREALEEIRAIEALRRDALAARRSQLPPFQHVPAVNDLVRRRVDAIRHDVERQTAPSHERFDALARMKLAAFRAELPALRERERRIRAANDALSDELQRIENAYGESRARTIATFTAFGWLDALAQAPFLVSGLDAPLESLDDPARADDVVRTVVLLARAFTRCRGRIAV